jgi:hypothetical protein
VRRCGVLPGAGLLAAAFALPAAAAEPLYVKNLSPVAGLLGFPSQRDAHTEAPRSLQAALHSSIASHYVNDSKTDESLNFDGETLRFALELRYGLAENWDVQMEVPWVDQSGGDLDHVIDDWHDFWGMSDGGRDDAPRDVLDYRYLTRSGGFGLQDDASGLGDISLSATYLFYRDGSAAASAALGYKFDSGDAQDFTGSGAGDAWIALRLSGDQLSDLPLTWHGQLGYLRAGEGDLIGDFQERNLWFAGLSMDWRFAQRWSLILQVDGHRAPLDSDITAVGDDAVLGTVGGRWRFAPHWSVDFSVVEDLRVKTAPDVTFQASVRYRQEPD